MTPPAAFFTFSLHDALPIYADTVDVLVNNTGTFIQGNVSDEPEGALETMLGVNLYSAYHTTRTLLPKMIAQQSGHRSEEHTSELQSLTNLVCRLLLEKKKKK